MKEQQATYDRPFPQKSKKEHVSGVRTINDQGEIESTPAFGGIRIEEALTIGVTPEALYSYWRDFSNLPRFCKQLKEVRVLDEKRSQWVVNGPGDKPLSWTAEIIEDAPASLISWRSVENSEFENAGSVRFRKAPGDRGTEVTLTMTYNRPAGPLGSLIAKLSAKDPAFLLKEQLRRLKQLLETGEISTTDGQSAVVEF